MHMCCIYLQLHNVLSIFSFSDLVILEVSSLYLDNVYIFVQTYRFGLSYALVTIGTLTAYAAFTLGVTQWRSVV